MTADTAPEPKPLRRVPFRIPESPPVANDARTVEEVEVQMLYLLRPHDIGRARGDDRRLPKFVDELLDERPSITQAR